MEYLNEDGSLDVARICNLPLKELVEIVGDFTQVQRMEFVEKSKPYQLTGRPVKPVVVDWSDYEGVDADEVLENLRKMCNIQ